MFLKRRTPRIIRDFYGKGATKTFTDIPIGSEYKLKTSDSYVHMKDAVKRILELRELESSEDLEDSLVLERDAEISEEEFLLYPPPYRTLRENLMDSLKNKSFKQIAPVKVGQMIKECRDSLKDLVTRGEASAVWSYGTSPQNFYLKWVKNLDQSRFLLHWLTAKCRAGYLCLSQFADQSVGCGDIVAVEFQVDLFWYRAEILEIRGDEVKCLFIDYGNVEICSVDGIRKIPLYIKEIPRMAFRAKLAGHFPPDELIDGDNMLDFVYKLKNSDRLKCKIVHPLKASSGFEVILEQEGAGFSFKTIFAQVPFENLEEETLMVTYYRDDEPVEKERELLAHSMEEFPEVGLEKVQKNTMNSFHIVASINPDEIYVRVLNSGNYAKLKQLQEQMSTFYSKSNYKDMYKIKTCRVLQNRVYAWFNKNREVWDRVRILRSDLSPVTAYVQRVDFGDKKVVFIEDMMELTPSVWTPVPPMAQLAHLAHVRPKDSGISWSKEACRTLQDIFAMDKFLVGVPISMEAGAGCSSKCRQCEDNSFGLVLFCQHPDFPYTVQGMLTGLGLAEAVGVGAGNPFVMFPDVSAIPRYRPIKENKPKKNGMANGHGNHVTCSDKVGTVDSNISIVGNVEELQMCRIIKPRQDGHKGFLGVEARFQLGWVEFCRIDGPGHFYLQPKRKQFELFEMMKAIGAEVERSPHSPFFCQTLEPGDIVAVQGTHQIDFDEYFTGWNRAFVIRTQADLKQARVIMLDFGIESHIKYELIRPLPSKYKDIPAFCTRAHIEMPDKVPAGLGGWSGDADFKFIECIKRYTSEFPVYLAFRKSCDSGILELDHFDQKVTFDMKSRSWIAEDSKEKQGSEYAVLNTHRKHKLLRHFFHSVGMEIYYEEDGLEEPFEPVWNTMVEYVLAL